MDQARDGAWESGPERNPLKNIPGIDKQTGKSGFGGQIMEMSNYNEKETLDGSLTRAAGADFDILPPWLLSFYAEA